MGLVPATGASLGISGEIGDDGPNAGGGDPESAGAGKERQDAPSWRRGSALSHVYGRCSPE